MSFLSIAGLAFVGAAPLVKFSDDKMQFRVHKVSAIICATCSQLVLVFNCPWLLLLWIPYIIAFIKLNDFRAKGWNTKIFGQRWYVSLIHLHSA